MTALVIDEWLWSDLSGENGANKQKEAFRFLEAVHQECDGIVTVENSRFARKLFDLCKCARDVKTRGIVKFYITHFLYNSDKSVMLAKDALPALSDEITRQVKQDDRYLVRACRKEGGIIVTTDVPLKERLERCNIMCEHRDDFVARYLARYEQKGQP